MNAPIVGARAWAPDVAVTLDVLAAEIELSAARCIFLDRLIGEVMEGLPEADRARMVQGLHAVDLLSQHLTGLSAFARGVSAAAPPGLGVPVDAAISEITLGALAERLTAGLGGANDDAGDEPDDGDVDLF
ncbi:hypothetical protein [Phenylobacterium sp.]|uniref:hypothetical protein n=1 Tax=Phenylobacterium sp. TaxID=1871053 RepID=UPI00122471F1|nr:hypothetical protein [Phenylobacterium sp.]TAL35882.1 MAG: hypothetical protein EPN98_06335 [Phenylobacterium sp.]